MLTHNEDLLLEYTLSSIKEWFSCFAIVDQSSTDNTVEIIKDILGDAVTLVIEREDYIRDVGFSGARNRASDLCSKPWIFHVDADETVVNLSEEMTAISEQADEKTEFLSVRRRNLSARPGITFPLAREAISRLPVSSDETHVRLYKRNAGLKWHSFIHEELWQGDQRVPYTNSECSLCLDHLSQLKGFDAAVDKEAYYAWMLLRGANFAEDDERFLSEYSRQVLSERRHYFTLEAQKYEYKLSINSARAQP